MNAKTTNKISNDFKIAGKEIKEYLILAGVFSAAVNTLMLVPIIYMLQVYDRVISSGSYATLAMLTVLMVFLLSASGGLEWARSMMLVGASNRLDKNLRVRVSEITFKRALLTGGQVKDASPINDLQNFRQFCSSNGIHSLFDAPWCPIYIAVMFIFHPWFGVAAVFSVLVMLGLAFLNDQVTSSALQEANEKSRRALIQTSNMLQNFEVIAAMGMEQDLRKRSNANSDETLTLQNNASKRAALVLSVSKSFRTIMQSLLLGLGALLALNQQISPGMMIAGSLLLGRALAPIDMLVGSWKGFTAAKSQYKRLNDLLTVIPEAKKHMPLPNPEGALSVEQLTITPPLSQKVVVRGVNLDVGMGEILGIVGPSASGKSSIARSLLGIWPSTGGKVRLDGADIAEWNREELGPHIGYLPQNIELFEGTISQNICRFKAEDPEKIITAAKAAGVHDLILELPNGYDTDISASGGMLSGGQRQRIGLARALFGNPRLVVLDEPNSNLDDQGEKALSKAISEIAIKGSIVVVITHRTSLLAKVDKILVMQNGVPQQYGPRDLVFSQLAAATKAKANSQTSTPVRA
jgi:ATP-binding cassette subfamily C protein EexD